MFHVAETRTRAAIRGPAWMTLSLQAGAGADCMSPQANGAPLGHHPMVCSSMIEGRAQDACSG